MCCIVLKSYYLCIRKLEKEENSQILSTITQPFKSIAMNKLFFAKSFATTSRSFREVCDGVKKMKP